MDLKRETQLFWKWVKPWPSYVTKYVVLNRPAVWVDQNTQEETTEFWSRKFAWTLRPRYWGFLQRLECGCSKRRVINRFVLYAAECEEHGLGRNWLKDEDS